MPFEPGKEKTGGRKKGTPNKDALDLKEKAQVLGVDPFEILLLFAKGDWKTLGYPEESFLKLTQSGPNQELYIQPAVRAKAASEACSYLYPKRKAIEISEHVIDATVEVYDFRHDDEPAPNQAGANLIAKADAPAN